MSCPIADPGGILEMVRDQNDGLPLTAKPVDKQEELLRFLGSDRRGRFVQDQHPRFGNQCLGNFRHLLQRHAKPGHPFVGVERDPEHEQLLSRSPVEHGPVDHPRRAHRLAPEIDILADVEVRNEIQLLMDRADAVRLRGVGILEVHRLTVEQDLAFVRLVNPGQEFDEGRFSGAILANQHVNLTSKEREGHLVERDDAGKPLRHIAQLQQRYTVAARVRSRWRTECGGLADQLAARLDHYIPAWNSSAFSWVTSIAPESTSAGISSPFRWRTIRSTPMIPIELGNWATVASI